MRSMRTVALVAATMLASHAAMAEEHIIRAVVDHWEPMVTYAKPGDTIKFLNMLGHDTETLDGMLPVGAEKWKAPLGKEGFGFTLDKPGAYMYKCNPHMSMGMVGVVVVGDGVPANLEAIEKNLDSVKFGKNMVARALRKFKEDLVKTGRLKK